MDFVKGISDRSCIEIEGDQEQWVFFKQRNGTDLDLVWTVDSAKFMRACKNWF